MSSPTTNVTRSSGSQVAETRPMSFLALAPTTSASYPQQPKAKLTSGALAQVPESPEMKRRSSSLSSDGTKNAGIRFLKLGPVHWGEHREGEKSDWNEVVIE